MAERIAEIVILSEDFNQTNLVRRSLKHKGRNPRTIRVNQAPSGRGSGEQYVRESFSAEVAHYRNRAASRSAALVVAIDADTKTVQQRERELEAALRAAGQEKPKPTEAISILIPKRHIETWILCLSGERVDELTDYSNREDVEAKIKAAAENLCGWARPRFPIPDRCVPSLKKGLREFQRLR